MASPFEKLRSSLSKTKDNLLGKLSAVISRRRLDDELLEEIEEILYEADVGVTATRTLIDNLTESHRANKVTEESEILELIKNDIVTILTSGNKPTESVSSNGLEIWLITGVNGVGKTTTIGKLANLLSKEGKKVMIAACDTFRAAAIDQIAIWAERSGVEIIRSQANADPSAVAFDAGTAAVSREADILLVDTAGRLHTKSHLMEELKKIKRVVVKAAPDASIYSKLVIDGTTGQNAISQVKVFTEAVGCDGLIITKLDGTAKGGVIIAIASELGVPVEFVGLGEGLEDIQRFEPLQFAEALFS